MAGRRTIFARLLRPFEVFFRTEALGSTVLILATAAALAWSNSPFAASYEAFWAAKVTVGAENFGLSKPLILWVNDALMALFFLVVGLEIKREVVAGELNSVRKAAGVIAAAAGGMVVPALLFLALAPHHPISRGWGVPMATDIAFALGCLRLLGQGVPTSLVVFLAGLAIVDDLGAIVVIALFYATDLSAGALAMAGLFTLALVLLNLFGVRQPSWYCVLGIPLWVALLKSGIHATIAGVVVGWCVPATPRHTRAELIAQVRELLSLAEKTTGEGAAPTMVGLKNKLAEWRSPLARLEGALHPLVAFGVMPVFALANAGVSLAGVTLADITRPVSLGIIVGLVAGKQIGVLGATFLAVKARLARLPAGVSWRQIHGLGVIAGIGFTMSLFIAGLAYGEGSPLHQQAKLGVLVASGVSAAAGLWLLARR